MFNAICKNAKLKDRIYCSFQFLNKELSSRELIQSIPYAPNERFFWAQSLCPTVFYPFLIAYKKNISHKVGLASASNYNEFAYWFPDKILQDTNQW